MSPLNYRAFLMISRVSYRMVYLYYISCLRYTILAGNPRIILAPTVVFEMYSLFVSWLLNVPATCECISGTDLLRQIYVLPH